MFSPDYYIEEVKQYVDINASDPYTVVNTVQWIENADFDVIIEGVAYDQVSYDPPAQLIAPPLEFNSSNIYTPWTFYEEGEFPRSEELLPDPFNQQNIYTFYESNEIDFPQPTTVPWAPSFDQDGLYCFFWGRYGAFPTPHNLPWAPAFDVNGIYSWFKKDNKYFHGFPNPHYCEWPEPDNPLIYKTMPDLIGKDLSVKGEIELFDEMNEKISTRSVIKHVVDRDAPQYNLLYQNFLENYFTVKGENE